MVTRVCLCMIKLVAMKIDVVPSIGSRGHSACLKEILNKHC